MTEFNMDEVFGAIERVPSVQVDLESVIAAIQTEIDRGSAYDIRVGSIWSRKGYPDAGSVSDAVSPSPYRHDEDIYISVAVLAPLSWASKEVKTVRAEAITWDETAKRLEEERARQDKLDKIAALRAEADRLEEGL